MDIGSCVVKRIFKMRKRGVYGSELIKKRHYWPNSFMEMELTITSGQNSSVIWDVFVVNGTKQSLII